MMEREAFLAAILATPADDTARLVYADWLDEHGEAARAEFVRVQVEVARHEAAREATGKSGWRTLNLRTRVEALRARERDLWDATAGPRREKRYELFPGDELHLDYTILPESFARPPTFPGHRGALVRRGFVTEIRCTLATFAGGRCLRRTCHGGSVMVNAFGWRKCRHCSGTGRIEGAAHNLFAAHPIEAVHITDTGHRIEIDPPGEGYGWQAYAFRGDDADYFTMNGWETRDEMVEGVVRMADELARWVA